jgi:hypothetical protein
MWKLATIDDLDFISQHITTDEVKIASGLSKVTRDYYIKYTQNLLSSPDCKTWLLITDGKLDQYFTSYNLKTLPYYMIFNYRKIAKPTKLFSTLHQQWDEVLDFIVPLQEANNLYSFYTLRVSARTGRKFIFDKRTSNMHGDLNSFHNRYFKVVEEYIPKNQSSKYETFDKLMFRGIRFEEDVFITKYICKQVYRTNSPTDFQENFLQLEKNLADKSKQQQDNEK